jgi:hypothetical protein
MVIQSVRRHRVRRFHRTPSSRLPGQKFEAPADLLARQYPTLFIQACAGV